MKKIRLCKILCVIMIMTLCYSNAYAMSVNELKKIIGQETTMDDIATISYIDEKEVEEIITNDLINEMRPFLKGVIDENISKNHKFTVKETLGIILKHPIKFITALYNYTVYSIKEILNIAEKEGGLDLEVAN